MKRSLTTLVAAAGLALGTTGTALAAPVKNVVIVHGAFADGSGWRRVADIPGDDGHTISAVQEPTSLADDAAATKRMIEGLNAPLLLVGHSYGGAFITQAGNEPQVRGHIPLRSGADNRLRYSAGEISRAFSL
jgi:pimeloyl-ACP methyl ester carboxylesterase